jgi:hypothetical protein
VLDFSISSGIGWRDGGIDIVLLKMLFKVVSKKFGFIFIAARPSTIIIF